MNLTDLDRSPKEIAEIERHKYFLSEKAGHDIGWQAAEQDWELHHADQFRHSPAPKPKARRVATMRTLVKRVLTKVRARRPIVRPLIRRAGNRFRRTATD